MATIDLMDRFGNLGHGGIKNNGVLDAEVLFQTALRTMRTDFIQVKAGDSIVYKNMNGMSSSWNILSFYTGEAQGYYTSGIAGQTTPQSGVWTAQQDGYIRLFGSFPAGDKISVTMTDLAPDVEDYLSKYNAMNYRFLPNSIPKIVAHIQEYLSNHPIADSTTLQAVIDAAFRSYLDEIQETADNYIAEAVPPAASAAVDAAASPALQEITAKAAEAAESARQAGLSQQSAEMSEENALTYRNQAQQIKDSITSEVSASVLAAQEQATLAQESAQAADQSADTAEQYVAQARAQAAAAAAQAQTASGYASDAQGYMQDASGFAQNASDFADNAAQSAATFSTDPTLTISGKAADAKATGDQLSDLESQMAQITSDLVLTADTTSTGWRLNQSDGLCSRNSDYKLLKFKVQAGKIYEIVSDDRFQFQTRPSVPSYGTNTNIIGSTYQDGTYFLLAPDTATDLIVSTPTESNASVTLKNITKIAYDNSEQLKDAVFRERVEPTSTANNWALMATGLSASKTGWKMMKYPVDAGDNIYIKTPTPIYNGASYQFQTNSSVGSSDNPYLVGSPVLTSTDALVTVPDGATWIIISALISDDESGVYRIPELVKLESDINQQFNNNIQNENKDATNKILASRWLRSETAKPLTLLWFSDIHRNKTNLERIIEYRDYLKSISVVDDTIVTGDLVKGASSEASSATYFENFWYSTPGTEDILIAIGNHEWYEQGTSPHGKITLSQANELFFNDFNNWGAVRESNYPFYYKDYASQGIRLIVTDPAIEAEADETTWLQTTLADARANGLSVVIASHYLMLNSSKEIQSATIIDNDWTNNVTRQEQTMTMNYDWTGSCDIVKCVSDFISDGGSFLCYIIGHWHWDFLCYPTGHPDQLIISIASATEDRTQTKLTSNDLPRYSDTRTQDAFNVVTFDAENKIIKCVRVGSNINMYEQPRTAFAYDVANHRFLSVI